MASIAHSVFARAIQSISRHTNKQEGNVENASAVYIQRGSVY